MSIPFAPILKIHGIPFAPTVEDCQRYPWILYLPLCSRSMDILFAPTVQDCQCLFMGIIFIPLFKIYGHSICPSVQDCQCLSIYIYISIYIYPIVQGPWIFHLPRSSKFVNGYPWTFYLPICSRSMDIPFAPPLFKIVNAYSWTFCLPHCSKFH